MRLWHESLLRLLPRQQLLGQHREACALRGNGWGKPHSVINYIYNHNFEKLIAYHYRVMDEMKRRNYNITKEWLDYNYRGKQLGYSDNINEDKVIQYYCDDGIIYSEHNDDYLKECLDNLKDKGIVINIKERN